MRPRHAPETSTIDGREARAQLALLLINAPDERVAAYTVDTLAHINRSPRKHIAEALAVEQARRAARG